MKPTLHKALSMLLTAAMVLNMGLTPVFAEGVAIGASGLSDCHTAHESECGFTEGTAEQPCTFKAEEDAEASPTAAGTTGSFGQGGLGTTSQSEPNSRGGGDYGATANTGTHFPDGAPSTGFHGGFGGHNASSGALSGLLYISSGARVNGAAGVSIITAEGTDYGYGAGAVVTPFATRLQIEKTLGCTVSITNVAEGTGSFDAATGIGYYAIGTKVTLTASAQEGFEFRGFKRDEGSLVIGNPATFTITAADTTVTPVAENLSNTTCKLTIGNATSGYESLKKAVDAFTADPSSAAAITMLDDETNGETLTIPSGKSLTLLAEGDRILTGKFFKVLGTLTLGKEGGMDSTNSLTLNGTPAETSKPSLIDVSGTFILYDDVTIQNCYTKEKPPAINCGNGILNLYGGTISDNIGPGIGYSSTGSTLNIGGSPVVKNNKFPDGTVCNFSHSGTINITRAMTAGADVGITPSILFPVPIFYVYQMQKGYLIWKVCLKTSKHLPRKLLILALSSEKALSNSYTEYFHTIHLDMDLCQYRHK